MPVVHRVVSACHVRPYGQTQPVAGSRKLGRHGYGGTFACFLVLVAWLSPAVAADVHADDPDYSDELPRIAPRSAEASLASIRIAPGYRADLIASEPLVTDPVAMAFDADGRLYVVEMRDYSEQDTEQLGRIRLLEDIDNDGVFDKATVFADKLSWPTAVIAFDGGVFVGAPPIMLWLKDTNDDRCADERRVVFEGFSRSNVQGLMNSLRWGLDNRIHGATGTAGGKVFRPDQTETPAVDLRGRDFSFDPRALDIRAEIGGGQHGMCFDDWGRKFCCSNSDHLQYVMYDQRYSDRFPELRAPRARRSIAADGRQAPVFRRSPIEPWRIVRTRLRVAGEVRGPVEGGGQPAGYFTGATGVTIYRGDAMPAERGRAFIADVGSNLVHRKTISFDHIVPIGQRIDQKTEFLTSDDIWFRPVQFANTPDGGLHVLDMSRETIEHPKSLPDMIKKHLDLTSGRDRGRLYRIVPQSHEVRASPQLSEASNEELLGLLGHQNAWHRETATRLLCERQDLAIAEQLASTVSSSKSPLARLHAFSALTGLDALDEATVVIALNDDHPRVRERAIRLSERFVESVVIRNALQTLANDPDPHVRVQLAFSIGEFPTHWRVPIAVRLLQDNPDNEWVRFATLTSLSSGAGDVVAQLLDQKPLPTQASALKLLAEVIGLQSSPFEVARVLQATGKLEDDDPVGRAMNEQLLTGLAKSRRPNASKLAENDVLLDRLQSLLREARESAVDSSLSVSTRSRAVRTLGLGAEDDDVELLIDLLDSREPPELQLAVIETLGTLRFEKIGEHIIERWSTLGPRVRNDAFEVLLSQRSWTNVLLSAIETGKLTRADWNAERLKLQRDTVDSVTRGRIETIIESSVSVTRSDVLAKYRPTLTAPGDADAGHRVFLKSCAACHRIGNEGFAIGPNLVTARNRGRETVLVNVLDPNREVNPEYMNYVVLTDDGRTHTGQIVEQSASTLTLRRAEKRDDVIMRKQIEIMKSSGQSLMPEGLERDINLQQMADLLAFLDATE